MIIDKLKAVNKAIQIEVRKDLWKEAKALVVLAPKDKIDELLSLHKKDNGNIFCLCLDAIKYNLVKSGKIKKSEFPNFGMPFGKM